MQVQIAKRADGTGVLRCIREDGSVTWQKQSDRHAAFFALHDLTHFSVETMLGYTQGFFGLVAQGWDMEETSGKGARGPIPPQAIEVEMLVGLFDRERGGGVIWTAEEFNQAMADQISVGIGSGVAARRLTEDQLAAVRKRRSELFQQWAAVPVGESLALTF